MVWTNGWKFNVSNDSQKKNFKLFIEFVRSSLGVDGVVMQDARRLTPQQDNPEFQDLELNAGGGTAGGVLNTVTLRLRTDNLYVVGFRNTAGRWFRFHGESAIAGHQSTELPFTGSYVGTNSIGPFNVPADVNLSSQSVEGAIHGLGSYTQGNVERIKIWLRTLIVSFIESARFSTIADTVATWGSGQLTQHLVGQIRNWGSLSSALMQAANDVVQDPDSNIFRQFIQSCGIPNAYRAAVTLGLVLITSKSRRVGRSLMEMHANDDVALGIKILEVLYVVILNIDGEDPGDLYGTVRVRDSFGSVYLFNRERSNIQSVRPGDRAELVWPDRAISAADDFVIELDLMDRDRDASPDDEVSRGEVVWNSRDAVSSNFNVVTSNLVTGKYGSAQVFYAVLTNAVVATVEVLLIDGDGESVPDVYGVVTAATKILGSKSLEYELFRQPRSEQVSVPANTNVPLRRKVITAVRSSPLTVQVDLWDKDTDLSPDDHIAVGSAAFQPRFQGRDAQQITGQYGKVEVRVTWSVSHS